MLRKWREAALLTITMVVTADCASELHYVQGRQLPAESKNGLHDACTFGFQCGFGQQCVRFYDGAKSCEIRCDLQQATPEAQCPPDLHCSGFTADGPGFPCATECRK